MDQLQARNIPLAVLSNKPHDFTIRYADAYLKKWKFEMVLGHSDRFPPKPDPASAQALVRQIGLPPPAFLFVGDSAVDMQTTRYAGGR